MRTIEPLKNPYGLTETLTRLKHYLTATGKIGALELLGKAEQKAELEADYEEELKKAFEQGSTVEYRTVFSVFGKYQAQTQDQIPRYPHHDAVNAIDSAMLHIKIGDIDDAIEFYNLMHR